MAPIPIDLLVEIIAERHVREDVFDESGYGRTRALISDLVTLGAILEEHVDWQIDSYLPVTAYPRKIEIER